MGVVSIHYVFIPNFVDEGGEERVIKIMKLTGVARVNSGRPLLEMGKDQNCTSGQYGKVDGGVCHYWW